MPNQPPADLPRRRESGRSESKISTSAEIEAKLPSGPQMPQGGTLTATVSHEMQFSGPYPHPAILERLEALDPGRAGKIMQLYEDQTRHRMGLEQSVINSDIARAWAGVKVGGFLSFFAICVGGTLVAYGHDAAGASIIGAVTVGLASTFVYGTISRRKERIQKAQLTTIKHESPPSREMTTAERKPDSQS